MHAEHDLLNGHPAALAVAAMSERATRPLRYKVMLPLLAIGILSAAVIGVCSYLSIEAQLMRQLRYRAVQLIDTVSVGSESLDEPKELQHVVLA